MPILQESHTWSQTNFGFQCVTCSAAMTQPQMATYAPNDNNAAMADMGDDQSIWNAAWQQIPASQQGM